MLLVAAIALPVMGVYASSPSDAERIVSKYRTLFEAPPSVIPSRQAVDGPLLGNGNVGAVISGKPESQYYWLSKNSFWRLRDGQRQGGPRPFGGLEIHIPALSNATYRVLQKLYPAITESQFSKGAITVEMRSLVAATEDVLLVELSVSGAPVEVRALLWTAPGRGSRLELGNQKEDRDQKALYWASKAFFSDVAIPTSAACAMSVVGIFDDVAAKKKAAVASLESVLTESEGDFGILDDPTKAKPGAPPPPPPGWIFTLRPGDKVTIAVAMQSSFDAKDPLAAVKATALGMTVGKAHKLQEQHTQWWREFWAKSLVEIDNPVLEQRYYLSQYLLGSCSRNPDFPPGLYGLWVTDDDPRWSADYHLNYNFEAAFYGLYSGNHIEQAAPFDAPVLAFMERGQAYAKDLLKVRGVYYPVGIGAKGVQTCAADSFLGQKINAAYCVVNMAMRWHHTLDKDYAQKVYPFVLEVANFWEDYLKLEGGRYVINEDAVLEDSGPDINSILSLGLVRNTFELATEMSTALGVDAGRQEKWQHILKNLSPFPTQEKDGATVFRYSEKGTDWSDVNTVGIQHIYPAGAIGLDSDPKLLEISRNTILAMNRWSDENGMSSLYPSAVRVGCDPEMILQKLSEMLATKGGINGLTLDNPYGIENCSIVPNTINEMLCMGHERVLRVFPVWPKGKDARFVNIRARDAFLVSSALKGGVVQFVKITSEKGRDCTLLNPWRGKAVEVYRDGKKIKTLKGDRVVLKTEARGTLLLGPEGEGCPIVE